jgi:hypothetical protein
VGAHENVGEKLHSTNPPQQARRMAAERQTGGTNTPKSFVTSAVALSACGHAPLVFNACQAQQIKVKIVRGAEKQHGRWLDHKRRW